jgi:hypothetical protein
MIDATVVCTHAYSARYGKDSQEKEVLGQSKGGFTTKIHALVRDTWEFILTPGQRHEITQTPTLIQDMET